MLPMRISSSHPLQTARNVRALQGMVSQSTASGFAGKSKILTWTKSFDLTLEFLLQNLLPGTSIAPEDWPSQKEIHLPTIHFWGLC